MYIRYVGARHLVIGAPQQYNSTSPKASPTPHIRHITQKTLPPPQNNNTATTIPIKMGIKSYIPNFLLPVPESERQPTTPYFDTLLRRNLFHKAKPGNEYTLSASRNNSVVSERRRSSASNTNAGMATAR